MNTKKIISYSIVLGLLIFLINSNSLACDPYTDCSTANYSTTGSYYPMLDTSQFDFYKKPTTTTGGTTSYIPPVNNYPTGTGGDYYPTIDSSQFDFYKKPTVYSQPYYGPINTGKYAPTLMNPGVVDYNNGTGGVIGTSSTGWSGWYTSTGSGTGTGGVTSTTTTTGTSGGTGTTGAATSVPSVSTLGTSNASSQNITLSGAWSNGGPSLGTWFEYGTSSGGLNLRTTGQQQNISSGTWSEQVGSLDPSTTYYYRAVTENSMGVSKGAIRSFTTRSLNPGTTTGTGTSTGGGTSSTTGNNTTEEIVSTGAIKISNRYTNICPTDEIDYAISYKNTTNRKLNDTTVKIYLPNSIEYRNSTNGTYRARDNSITVFIGGLDINQSGIIYVTGEATRDAYKSNSITARAEMTYDGINKETVKEQTTVTNISEDCKDSSLGALAIFGGNSFLPTTFIGWLFLILFILFIVWLSRKFMYQKAAHGGHDSHDEKKH